MSLRIKDQWKSELSVIVANLKWTQSARLLNFADGLLGI